MRKKLKETIGAAQKVTKLGLNIAGMKMLEAAKKRGSTVTVIFF